MSTHRLPLWPVIEGKGEAIVGQAGDLGHRGIPDPPTTIEVKKLGGEGETKKRTIEGHSEQEIGPDKQMPDGSPVNSEWNLGQEEKSCLCK